MLNQIKYMNDLNFTAIDFETMTAERSSACAIGLVKVIDGVILEKYYTLLKPIPDDREATNSLINGITREMVQNAPTFKEAWGSMEPFIKGQHLVAHNAAFDVDVLSHQLDYYGIDVHIGWPTDTYKMTGKPLEETCKEMGIPLESHHDALCDAVASAEIYLRLNGKEILRPLEIKFKHDKAKELSKEAKQPLAAEDVKNKNTSFFQKKVVFTGNLDSFPQREIVAELLREYGADINSSISRKTDIVIVGRGAGPSKMKKIQELQEGGYGIRVLHEHEFLQILEEEGIR